MSSCVTVEDRLYKFLILRKSSSYWIWGTLGVGVFLFLLIYIPSEVGRTN